MHRRQGARSLSPKARLGPSPTDDTVRPTVATPLSTRHWREPGQREWIIDVSCIGFSPSGRRLPLNVRRVADMDFEDVAMFTRPVDARSGQIIANPH
jgi:hypothetical protein